MAIGTTYSELVSVVQAAYENDDQEFSNFIPSAIKIIENKLIRELDPQALVSTESVPLTVGATDVSFSVNTAVVHDVSYTEADEKFTLEQRTDDYLDDYWPNETSVGTPLYYSRDGVGTIRVIPPTATSVNVNVRRTAQPDRLSTSNESNYFSDYCDNALYYGTMAEMSRFDKNFESSMLWENLYNEEVARINNEIRRERTDDNTETQNPSPRESHQLVPAIVLTLGEGF